MVVPALTHIKKMRMECIGLSRDNHDVALLGQIVACTNFQRRRGGGIKAASIRGKVCGALSFSAVGTFHNLQKIMCLYTLERYVFLGVYCVCASAFFIYCTHNTHIEKYTLTHTVYPRVRRRKCIFYLLHIQYIQYTHTHIEKYTLTRARVYIFPGVIYFLVCIVCVVCVQVHFLFTAHTIHT